MVGHGGRSRQRPCSRISPDQKSVAFTRSSELETNVWLFDVASNNGRRFTFEPSGNGALWSPDSSRILYATTRQNEPVLIERPASGIGAEATANGLSRTVLNRFSSFDERFHL